MDQNDVQNMLRTPEGRRLVSLLGARSGALRQAGEAAKAGDTAKAMELMGPALQDPEVRRLLEKLGRSFPNG